MALALDASTPVLFTSANDPWTSASFTPPNGSLLVVKIMADWFTSGTPLIAVTSSGLTFERVGRIGAASQGLAEVWIARVESNGGTARTVSATTTITDDTGGIKVEVWTGFNSDDPIDGFVCQANNTTNNISPACVTTTDGAWLTGGGVDWQNLGAATSSDTNEHGEPGGVAILSVRKSAATGTAGSATLNLDASGTGAPVWTWVIAALRADTADPSPIYKVADRGSTQNLTAQTSTAVDMAAAGSIAVGNYLIARLALDNSRTDTAGAAVGLTVTDPRSNTWTVTAAGNADPGAANAGSTCYIAYTKVTNAYTDGDDVTFNYTGTGNSVPAKAIVIEEWFGINKTTPLAVAATTTSGATATGSIARTPTAAGQLVYGALSYEGAGSDQITSDPDQTDGSWLLTNQIATTSGTATSNQATVGIYKRVTGTSAQTWNIALPASRDWGAVMLVFDVEPGGASGAASGTFGFTATGNGVRSTHGVAVATLGFTATAVGTGPQKFIASTAGSGTAAYFVDQVSDPILIRGYVLWGLLMNAGRWNAGDWQQDLEDAVAGLQAMGCNVVYTEPLGNTQNGGAFNNGNTHDGVAPFTSTSPVTFNDTFWDRSDYLFDLCEAAGITVFFNWAYSDDLDTAALAGFNSTQFGQYGTALGNRYKTRPNLVWMMGGDYFDTFASQVATVKSSIRATGDTHLFGVQNYPETTSRKDIEDNSTSTTGTNSSEFNFVYSYNAIYWGIEYAWTESSPLPVLWGDGHFDADTTADRKVMRDLTWWTFSSGGRGMIYGSEGTWAWGSGALANLTSDTFPNTDMDGIQTLFASLTNWHQLVPDTDSSFVTAGRGTKSDYVTSSGGGGGEYNSSDTQSGYVTASITADGTLAVVYFPVDQTITVDDTELNAGYTATWVDPISGATSSATIASTYSPTGNNSLGGPDWLLVFEASAAAVTGQAVGAFGFTGSALGVDRSVGAAGGVLGFTAVVSGVDRAVGAAVAVFGFTATSAGVDRAVGAAGAALGFAATAVGEIGTPPVAGQAVAAFGFTATAQGIDRSAGAALAALGFTATASGAVGTPPVTGTALAVFGFTGSASGAPRTSGAAVASFGFTATVSGVDRAVGAAAAAFGFVGAASGIDRAVGAANASFGFAATAAGVPEVFAVAVALFGFTATTQGFAGTPPVAGVAAALFGFTATTQGQPRTPGVAVASFGFTGTSAGRRRVVASAAGGFGFTGGGFGVRGLPGVAQAVFGFAAFAAGQGATVSADSIAAVRANVTSTPVVTVVATSSATATG